MHGVPSRSWAATSSALIFSTTYGLCNVYPRLLTNRLWRKPTQLMLLRIVLTVVRYFGPHPSKLAFGHFSVVGEQGWRKLR
jgi:hypothetical protein